MLLALDGLGPDTSLLGRVEAHLGERGLGIIDAMAGAAPREYGALAPLVLDCAERGDAVALGIVETGATYLSDMAQNLLSDGGAALCMLGGLGEKLIPWMRPELAQRIVPPLGQPDEGAVRFAMQRYLGETSPAP